MDEDSERKKLRVSDSSTANYKLLTKVELMERLNDTQIEKQRTMRLTLWISHQIVSEGVKTSKQQHSTLRYIVKNAEPQFEKNSLRWLLSQTRNSKV